MTEKSLLRERRFYPLFWTQFFGAFNDNIFRNALFILVTYKVATSDSLSADALVQICAGIFILPFFLFSATAGQLADKYEKGKLIRFIKIAEICIMSITAVGFFMGWTWLLIAMLFFMGLQSACFGPLKYGILPQHLEENELVSGNGLVEMGTFLAILFGTIYGGFFIAMESYGAKWIGVSLVFFAIMGWISSLRIPKAKSHAPDLKVNWNFIGETKHIMGFAREKEAVFLSIMGISWFWFFGSSFLTKLPTFTKETLGGSEHVVTFFLATFSLGIGFGSVLCDKFSGKKVELGLVPFGSIGMTLFSFDLFLASQFYPKPMMGSELMDLREFLIPLRNWRIIIDLFLISVHSGFFIVPLFALVQQRSAKKRISRVIAANNILNSLFMVVSSIMLFVIAKQKMSIPYVFLILAILNTAVAIFIYKLLPEFLIRFMVWILVNTIYRLKVEGLEHIPEEGPAVLVCNHVTFIDGLIISAASKRMIRFVVDKNYTKFPIVRYFFEKGKAIPIAPFKEDPNALNKAFDEIAKGLEHGDLIGIFPEGRLTNDGKIKSFRPGIEKIIERTPVPVVPMALQGLWESWFSRIKGKAMKGFPGKVFYKIALKIDKPVAPNQVRAASLEERIKELRGERK